MNKIGLTSAMLLVAALGFWLGASASREARASDARKKAVETSAAPKAIGPYSQAVVAGEFVYLAGQIGLDPQTGAMVAGGTKEQAEQVMKNLEAVLKAAGSDFEQVVKATIYLADINDFAAVNEIYGRRFKAPYPARATVQAARLPRDARVEIELTALVKK